MTITLQPKTVALNDQFRKGDSSLGLWYMAPKVAALPQAQKQELVESVQEIDNFIETKATRPNSEHDFGLVTYNETDYLWTIDYSDKQLKSPSPNPADPSCTTRVLTLMRADEY